MYLLDTNVVSEPTKRRPDPAILEWLNGVDEEVAFLSAVTLMELRYGAERLPLGRQRRQLEAWLDRTVDRFAERTLAVDVDVANAVGRIMAQTEASGRPVRGNDVIIAGTALWHRLTVVTRNAKHFEPTGVEVLNPWEQSD